MKVSIEWDEIAEHYCIEASDLSFASMFWKSSNGSVHMELTKEDLRDLYYAIEEVKDEL